MNYHGKKFRTVTNTTNGDTSADTVFEYQQTGNMLTGSYSGGRVRFGQLIGLVDDMGRIDMRYHQINTNGELMTGTCQSVPEVSANGKLLLHETWAWTSGDQSTGSSIIEEI